MVDHFFWDLVDIDLFFVFDFFVVIRHAMCEPLCSSKSSIWFDEYFVARQRRPSCSAECIFNPSDYLDSRFSGVKDDRCQFETVIENPARCVKLDDDCVDALFFCGFKDNAEKPWPTLRRTRNRDQSDSDGVARTDLTTCDCAGDRCARYR